MSNASTSTSSVQTAVASTLLDQRVVVRVAPAFQNLEARWRKGIVRHIATFNADTTGGFIDLRTVFIVEWTEGDDRGSYQQVQLGIDNVRWAGFAP